LGLVKDCNLDIPLDETKRVGCAAQKKYLKPNIAPWHLTGISLPCMTGRLPRTQTLLKDNYGNEARASLCKLHALPHSRELISGPQSRGLNPSLPYYPGTCSAVFKALLKAVCRCYFGTCLHSTVGLKCCFAPHGTN